MRVTMFKDSAPYDEAIAHSQLLTPRKAQGQ
jgi:hypothetical protein